MRQFDRTHFAAKFVRPTKYARETTAPADHLRFIASARARSSNRKHLPLDMNERNLWVFTRRHLYDAQTHCGSGHSRLAVAFLPGVADGLSAAGQPACCSGIMCPMHRNGGQKIICDMALGHQGAQLEACPSTPRHYAALVFVPIASAVLFVEWLVDSAPVFALPVAAKNGHDVALPPPRSVPT